MKTINSLLRKKNQIQTLFLFQEKLDEEYHNKIEENKRKAEERTAIKRAKRLKKKQKSKMKAKQPKTNIGDDKSSQCNSDSNSDEDLELDSKQKTDETTGAYCNNVKSDSESVNDNAS